jgi:hypothetical protein
MKFEISKKKFFSILLLLFCIFISLYLSDIPFIVNLQNKCYYDKIIDEYNNERKILGNHSSSQNNFPTNSYGRSPEKMNKEGMTDVSANNMIYDIINEKDPKVTVFQQLLTVRQIAEMGDYSKNNAKNLKDILDSSGNSDTTKITNLNRFINTYIYPKDSK